MLVYVYVCIYVYLFIYLVRVISQTSVALGVLAVFVEDYARIRGQYKK